MSPLYQRFLQVTTWILVTFCGTAARCQRWTSLPSTQNRTLLSPVVVAPGRQSCSHGVSIDAQCRPSVVIHRTAWGNVHGLEQSTESLPSAGCYDVHMSFDNGARKQRAPWVFLRDTLHIFVTRQIFRLYSPTKNETAHDNTIVPKKPPPRPSTFRLPLPSARLSAFCWRPIAYPYNRAST